MTEKPQGSRDDIDDSSGLCLVDLAANRQCVYRSSAATISMFT